MLSIYEFAVLPGLVSLSRTSIFGKGLAVAVPNQGFPGLLEVVRRLKALRILVLGRQKVFPLLSCAVSRVVLGHFRWCREYRCTPAVIYLAPVHVILWIDTYLVISGTKAFVAVGLLVVRHLAVQRKTRRTRGRRRGFDLQKKFQSLDLDFPSDNTQRHLCRLLARFCLLRFMDSCADRAFRN